MTHACRCATLDEVASITKFIVSKEASFNDACVYSFVTCRCATLDEVAAITKFIVSKEASFNTAYCFDLTGGRATY